MFFWKISIICGLNDYNLYEIRSCSLRCKLNSCFSLNARELVRVVNLEQQPTEQATNRPTDRLSESFHLEEPNSFIYKLDKKNKINNNNNNDH